jgi:hypothetical protein
MWRGRQRQDIKTKQIHGAAKRGWGLLLGKSGRRASEPEQQQAAPPAFEFIINSALPPLLPQPTNQLARRALTSAPRAQPASSSPPPRLRHATRLYL